MKKPRHGFYIANQPNRILNILAKKREMCEAKFTEKDLRGLSKIEKQFIIDNNYYRVYRRCGMVWDKYAQCGEYYILFIGRDSLKRKRLYAYSNIQAMFPNGKDIMQNAYNYECWLTLNAKYYTDEDPIYRVSDVYEAFSKFGFEYHFSDMPTMQSSFFFN